MRKVLVALVAALFALPVLADVTGLVSPPGGSGGSSLPSQTGNSGKYLTTDGTSPSWASPTASASSITPGTTTVVGATAPCLIDNSATTVMGCLAETGTGSAVLATSPTLVTPNLGTPSAINLTNATALPCSAMPALTGDATTTAGSCATTVSKVNGAAPPTSALVGGWNSSGQPIAETQGADTTLCNATGSTAAPTACSALTEIGVLSSTAPVNETTSFAPTDRSNAFGEYDMNDASANTFTLNSGLFNTNDTLTIYQKGAGLTSIALGAGVTLTGPGNLGYATLGGQGGYIQIEDTGSDAWRVIAYQPADTKFTITGGTCATAAATSGGNMGGTITSAATGTVASCTYIITSGGGLTAKNMWVGTMADQTQLAVPAWQQSAQGTTTITFTVPGATAASDVLTFTIHAE